MLSKLYEIGKKYYEFKGISYKNISKSCCLNEECMLIDFDKVKEKVTQKHNLQTPSSCNGLKLCIEENLIDFIEFKSFKKYIKHQKTLTQSEIDKQIEKFDFEKKIKDSIFIIEILLNSNIAYFTKKEIKEFEKIKKKYFVVSDLDLDNYPLESLDFTLSFLSSYSYVNHIKICIEDNLDGIDVCFLIEKPKLLHCSEICEKLCKV